METIEMRLSARPTIGVPTIVLHGEGDTIHPPEMSASCAFVAKRIKSNLSAAWYCSIGATGTESATAVPPTPDTRKPDDRSTLADSAVRVASQTGIPALIARVAIVPPNAPIPTINIRVLRSSLISERFKVFLLAVMVGLRRREIDLLEWSAFRWDQNVIRIEPTRYFEAKREYSYADVEVDPELMRIFRGYRASATGDFVIESDVGPRPGATFEHYRCTIVFEKLIAWLREKGVAGSKPIHALRKEFGSQINAKHGLYSASRALRHGNIEVTAQVYVDKRRTSRNWPWASFKG